MIVTEYPYHNNKVRHYSDAGLVIRQVETGNEYGEAVDVYPCPYTYVETDKPIEDSEATEGDYQQALGRLGVNLHEEE